MTLIRRVGLEALGWLLLVGGVAALILPGPGLIMVFLGLAVLSQRYAWAARRLEPVKERALTGAEQSVESWPRIAASLLGVAFLGACGVLWIVRPDVPDWWPVRDSWWLLGGIGTGATLLISAAVALGLVVWSYRTYRARP